jgi:heterodisulfide reductase subunit A-like polyferredoxin
MLGTAAAMSPAFQVEIAVIGAGVIGLAIARSLAMAGKEVLLLDRASAICTGTLNSRHMKFVSSRQSIDTMKWKRIPCFLTFWNTTCCFQFRVAFFNGVQL